MALRTGEGGEEALFWEISRTLSVTIITIIIILLVTEYFIYARFCPEHFI